MRRTKFLARFLPFLCILNADPSGIWMHHAAAFETLLTQPDLYGNSILNDKAVAGAARRTLGKDYERFTEILNVSGPVKIVGNRYVFGQGCQPHACDETGAMIVVDTKAKKVWAAMTDGDRKAAWPTAVARWPAEVRQVVKASYQ